MFRVASLVAGALAGFVASLILALGGLEVTASSFGGLGERQLALARFGLIFIANLSLLGAGVGLALPRAGAILLFVAGAAWAGAALYLGHKTDLVLFGPPVLALLGVVLGILGDLRSRRGATAELPSEPQAEAYVAPDPYDVAPAPRGAQATSMPPARSVFDEVVERDPMPSRLDGRVERKAAPVTVTPTFRNLEEEEYEEDYDEPSPLWRLAGGLTNLLSFGLYAAAAAGVLLVIYNLYQRDNGTALVTNPEPKSVSSIAEAALPPSSSAAPQPMAPAPVVVVTPPPPPASSSAPPPAAISTALAPPATPSSQAPEPVRVVGEPAPEDAVPSTPSEAPPSSSAAPEPSSQPSSEPIAVAEAAPLPTPDFVDNAKVAPVPAVMSPQLAAARRAGTFDNVQPDSFAVAPAFTGSDI